MRMLENGLKLFRPKRSEINKNNAIVAKTCYLFSTKTIVEFAFGPDAGLEPEGFLEFQKDF